VIIAERWLADQMPCCPDCYFFLDAVVSLPYIAAIWDFHLRALSAINRREGSVLTSMALMFNQGTKILSV